MGMKKILGGIASVFTGGLADTAMSLVDKFVPDKLSELERGQLAASLREFELKKQIEVNAAMNKAEQTLNARVEMYEGTAKELRSIPFLGPIMLFLRGSQRIVWGFATLYFDWIWLAGETVFTPKQETGLMVINLLVLGFLFGERAVKNVMPLVTEMFHAKTGQGRNE